jgi:hypothetical protein
MSYLSSFGPTSFDIAINGHDLELCVKLTATTNPANGTYTMYVGEPGEDGCSDSTLREVATVTLDEDGEMTDCQFGANKFSGRSWQSMSGTFNADGTGSGEINDDANPTGINGTWAAGGSGEPSGNSDERKHSQHA